MSLTVMLSQWRVLSKRMVLSEFMSGLRLEAQTPTKRPDLFFQLRDDGEMHESIVPLVERISQRINRTW